MPVKGRVVRVTNRNAKDGYRRAGIAHPRGHVDHAFDKFDEGQLAMLVGDPSLEVQIVNVPKGGAASA